MNDQRSARPLAVRDILLASLASALASPILIGLIVYALADEQLIALARDLFNDRPENQALPPNLGPASYLSIMTNFYTTILTVLIFVLSLVSAFAFFFIRTNSIAHVGEKVEEFVPTYFQDGAGAKVLKEKLEEPITERISSSYSKKFNEIRNRLDDFEVAFEQLGVSVTEKLDEVENEARHQ